MHAITSFSLPWVVGLIVSLTTAMNSTVIAQSKLAPSKLAPSKLASPDLVPAKSLPAEFYKPVAKSIEGWTVKVNPELLLESNQKLLRSSLAALTNHLQRIKFILSDEKVAELQRLPIWLGLDNQRLVNLQYHPSSVWLERNGHDPALAKHVHIPVAKQLIDRRQWAKHPCVILHELAHAYHDQVLGFDDAEIIAAFEEAKKSGIYDQVLAHDHRTVRHYALSNHKEYFAESTEAFLGVNDFYPFVRAELKQHDPRMYFLLVKIWGEVP